MGSDGWGRQEQGPGVMQLLEGSEEARVARCGECWSCRREMMGLIKSAGAGGREWQGARGVGVAQERLWDQTKDMDRSRVLRGGR
eukprot:scaffold30224_cov17-Tisochrysis_lutea.AAC.1